ncbi:spore germination protein (amino acid permease) [Fontibacillus solani]|uniref:Spore germination protein (Amino acid permease) n=1 Tax=Fontibacillus solani TaxID=1572857 RepID=A0A7W3SVQ1_9BACL|nr:endospore germination permease [Fontibacillus solani]MBA9087120.1 spore germination protein (amino acid permease) [Fontibacillus solani]
MLSTLKPTISQAIMTIMLTVGITNHVFIIPAILQSALRDAWVAVLLSGIPFAIYTGLLVYISSHTRNMRLYEWLELHFGKIPSYVFRVIFTLFFFTVAWFSLFDTVMWTKVSFMPFTPVIVTSLTLMILCFSASRAGIRSITFTAGLLLPLVIVLGFYVGIVNIEHKDYNQLFPIFENGLMPILRGGLYSCTGLFELSFLLFLQPHLAKPLKKRHYLFLFVIMLGLTLGPLTGSIAEFNPFEAATQRYPAYEEWRIAGFGKYISQTDFFSIYQWLSGTCTRISLALFFAADMWKFKMPKQRSYFLLCLAILLVPLGSYALNDMTFLQLSMDYIFPGNLILLTAFALLFSLSIFINTLKKGSSIHDS